LQRVPVLAPDELVQLAQNRCGTIRALKETGGDYAEHKY